MTQLVGYLVLFVGVGVFFLFIHLFMGKQIRPSKPDPDKLTVYECGEPTIGSAWIQFDLRFYVVALLFVIFDVEVAFFFPWAVVFGKANAIAKSEKEPDALLAQARELDPKLGRLKEKEKAGLLALPPSPNRDKQVERLEDETKRMAEDIKEASHQLAWFAFWDIMVFFAVLLVGFGYLWRRGDLDWVRSIAAEEGLPQAKATLTPGRNGGPPMSARSADPVEIKV